ncbi:hypothetical protein Ciccas_013764 [Cichlidogyrus casuarinus]|uniref:Phospholipase A2-like central domain-containing protein n=1 Tax=Cichlidogyrus casuarinus TaxID=1844966 RepID=A0ABD2PLK2_9PLAT
MYRLVLVTFCTLYFPKVHSIIYPCTKWCGPDNVASHYDDLGSNRDVDMCCRDHDHCALSLASGETLRNYRNEGWYTESACYCDQEFAECLQSCINMGNFAARLLRFFFFDLAKMRCLILYTFKWSRGFFVRSLNFYEYENYRASDETKRIIRKRWSG